MNMIAPITSAEDRPVGKAGGLALEIELSVHDNIAIIEPEWREFEQEALGTFYQTYAWCSAWQEAAGREHSSPRIVIGRDRRGRARFLLPLCLRRRNGLQVLEWMAAPQTTYGYGFFDPDFLSVAHEWFAAAGLPMLRSLAVMDAIHLGSMPRFLYGHPHPLSAWFTCSGVNCAYRMALGPDYDALYRTKRSTASRRQHRKRDARLRAAGETMFGLPSDSANTHMLIDRMLDQQTQRLANRGIFGIFDDADRAFLHRLADCEGPDGPALLPYHLTIDGELVSMKLGGLSGGTYWALVSSLDGSRLPHLSPGDATLRWTIEACCRQGLRVFDFASGDASYKRPWADEIIPLHECIKGITPLGNVWAAAKIAETAAKRAIKRSPVLWSLVNRLRRRFAGQRH